MLVRNGGSKLQRNLARELISDEELMTQLRLQGIDDMSDVEVAAVEGNGEVSVIATPTRTGRRARVRATRAGPV